MTQKKQAVMKKSRLIPLLLCVAIFLTCFSCFAELRIWNPLSAGMGLLGVCVLGEEYVISQRVPNRVVLAQPSMDVLFSVMEQWVYATLPEEQMGSIHTFLSPSGEPEHVQVQMNGYFAKWIWQ